MPDKQTEADRLADAMARFGRNGYPLCNGAAVELRRLSAFNAELVEALRLYVQYFESHLITNTHAAQDFDFTGQLADCFRAALSRAGEGR